MVVPVFENQERYLCEITIYFLVGDNFFKTASYTIEALCAATFESSTHKLKDVEQQILRKRTELRQFETEYRKVIVILYIILVNIYLFYSFLFVKMIICFLFDILQALAQYQEVTTRYSQEKQNVSIYMYFISIYFILKFKSTQDF